MRTRFPGRPRFFGSGCAGLFAARARALARFRSRFGEEVVEEVCALGDFEEVAVGLGGRIRERFACGFSLDFGMGDSAHLLEAYHGAVERIAMFGAEWIAALGPSRARSPERIIIARVNEGDAKRHANIRAFSEVRFRSGGLQASAFLGFERGERRPPEGGPLRQQVATTIDFLVVGFFRAAEQIPRLPERRYGMTIHVVHAAACDSMPPVSRATTAIRCFPDSKSSSGLVALIPWTRPSGFDGSGISKSFKRCFAPAEMS
jgi:hypothetical protein